jgi:predicted Holliday junction resolvase-like endonuclease
MAVVATLVLCVKYYQTKTRYDRLRDDLNTRVQQEVVAWKDRELESEKAKLSHFAEAHAQVKLEAWKIEAEEKIRKDAVDKSSAVLSGKVTEHLAPYLPGFPYDPRDARFLGSPIDLIVFDGMAENDVREIVFLEVKTGSSSLSTRERRVRDAVEERRVSWRLFHREAGHDPPSAVPGAPEPSAGPGSPTAGSGGQPWWKQEKDPLP